MDGSKEHVAPQQVASLGTPGPGPTAATVAEGNTLEDLIERWRGPLVGFAYALGTADPVALAQDTLAEAWIGRQRFRGDFVDDTAVGSWLRGIARNLARTEARRARGRPRSLQELEDHPAARAPAEAALGPEAVRAAIAELPPDQREAVWMHHLEGTPVRRVAALLGVTERTVEGRLYRARRALARRLGAKRQGEA